MADPLLVKPCDIPIYGDLADKSNVEKPLEPAKVSETYESAVGAVRETRLMALLGWGQLQAFKARADQFVNTGIAHTAASIEIVKDKENTMEQAGFIGGSALFGYILGAFSRRARLLKKLVYSGTLGGGAGYVCYPEEMTAAANYAAEEGNKLGLIAYNFIAGVQPNGGGGVDSNPEAASAAAVNPSTVEKDVLSEDDKKFLSSSEASPPERDQTNPADVDMYSRRDDK